MRTAAVAVLLAIQGAAWAADLSAQGEVRLRLRGREFKRIKIAVAPFTAQDIRDGDHSLTELASLIESIVRQDMGFSLRFEVLSPTAVAVMASAGGEPVEYGRWSLLGADNLLRGRVEEGQTDFGLEVELHDVTFRTLVRTFSIRLPSPESREFRFQVHRLSDELQRTLTGDLGIATSRLAYIRRVGGARELMVVDYDGFDPRPLTDWGTINLSPAWSPDARLLVFTSYRNGNPDLLGLHFLTGRVEVISDRAGLNTAPAWSPDGERIAYTMSVNGDAEIFLMNRVDGRVRRLTYTWGIDTSPSWSPDGREIVFMSERAGSPNIYIMEADGTNVRRLTWDGTFNDSPAWSPLGDRIAYVSRVEGQFQLFTMDLTGGDVHQLTFRANNEDPIWSPDGLHLAFSSDRDGRYQVYTIAWDGSRLRQVTTSGVSTLPTWSPRLAAPLGP